MPTVLQNMTQRPSIGRTVPTLNPPSNPNWNDPTTLAPTIGSQSISVPGTSPLEAFSQDFAAAVRSGPQAAMQQQLLRQAVANQSLNQQQSLIEQQSGLVGAQSTATRSLLQTKMEMEREKRLSEQGNVEVVHDSKGNVWVFRKDKLAQGDVKGGVYPIISNPYQPIDKDKAISDLEAEWGPLAPEHKTVIETSIDASNEAKSSVPYRQSQEYVATQRRLEANEKARLAQAGTDTKTLQRLDKSYQYNTGLVEAIRKPLADRLDRLNRLQVSVNERTPQADALIAPELLTAMAGGAGSGLRMNEAEISRIVGGRTNWESIKAAVNKWQLDPSKGLSVTDAQRTQIQSLLNAMTTKVRSKSDALDSAQQDLINASTPEEHRQIFGSLRKRLTEIDLGGVGSQNANRIRVRLPDGRTGTIDASEFNPKTMTKVP